MVASQIETSMKMSGEKSLEIVGPVVEKKNYKRAAYISGIIFALVTVVIGSTLGAFYFGHAITRSTYKDAHLYYRDDDGRLVKEDVSIREKQVEFNTPGQFTAIYDFRNMQAIFHTFDDEDRNKCYVTELTADMGTIDDMINAVNEASNSDGILPTPSKSIEFIAKNTTFNGEIFSDAAKKLCAGLPLEMLQTADDSTGKSNVFKRALRRRCRRRRRRRRGGRIVIVIVIIFC